MNLINVIRNNGRITCWLLSISVMLGFVVFLAVKINSPKTLPISHVSVKNAPAKYQPMLKKTLRPLLAGGFFTINIQRIQKRLEAYPWVSQVQVQRVWPDQLMLNIKPQRIIARWNKNQVLNNYGEVFSQNEVVLTNELPRLMGPKNSELEVLDYFQKAQGALKSINITVVSINLGRNNDWRLILNDGLIIKLEHNQFLARLHRFVTVYPKVFAGRRAISVDLRYPSGMAVEWKKG